MAAIVIELAAKRSGQIILAAIGDAALGVVIPCKTGTSTRIEQRRGDLVAVVVLVQAVVGVNPEAGEFGIHDEVDHARDRICAIGGRGTTGQHFNALHQAGGNEVKIGCR